MNKEWLVMILAISNLLISQMEKYKQEHGLDDAGMRDHLKELNAEDDKGFDAIIAIAEQQKAAQSK